MQAAFRVFVVIGIHASEIGPGLDPLLLPEVSDTAQCEDCKWLTATAETYLMDPTNQQLASPRAPVVLVFSWGHAWLLLHLDPPLSRLMDRW